LPFLKNPAIRVQAGKEALGDPRNTRASLDPVIKSLHHITAITSDAAEAIRFYTRILGLHLVKKTVNFDDPTAYHLYFGDEKGTPGTILTLFDWGRSINRGSLGAGVTHHLAFATENDETLLKWKTRLEQYKIPVEGPFNRKAGRSIYLLDPDGLIIEIATPETDGYSDDENPEPSLFSRRKTRPRVIGAKEAFDPGIQLLGLQHATAIATAPSHSTQFYKDTLGATLAPETKRERRVSWQWFLGQNRGSANFLSFIESSSANQGLVGAGTVHHIAFAIDDEEEQTEWRTRLLNRGVRVTAVLDRKYFKSIYFREPNGILLEIATIPPGFTVDEPPGHLGRSLTLPEWLEARRPFIEASLKPIGPID